MQSSLIRRFIIQRHSLTSQLVAQHVIRSRSARSLNSKSLSFAHSSTQYLIRPVYNHDRGRSGWKRKGWRREWRRGWEWCESVVRSINRRSLLCAGAVFLWDRERINNQYMEARLKKYERQFCANDPVGEPHPPIELPTEPCPIETPTVNEEFVDNKDKTSDRNRPTEEDPSIAAAAVVLTDECEDDNGNGNSLALNDSQLEERTTTSSQSLVYRLYNYFVSMVPTLKSTQMKRQGLGGSDRRQEVEELTEEEIIGSKRMNEEREGESDSEFVDCATQEEDLNNTVEKNVNQFGSESETSRNSEVVEAAFDDNIELHDFNQSTLKEEIESKDQFCEESKDPLFGWEFLLEQEDCKVYTKPYGDSGLSQYKVIGSYSDITARDFSDVQMSLESRKEWDSYIVKLEAIDRDSRTGSEIIHYILKYPFPMSNREYVYVKRSWISPNDDAIVIVNRSVDHPAVPEDKKYVRVKNYYSEMVIKPNTFIDELGFQYELTYFDDPGVLLPSSAVSWVSKSAMPEFLNKIHKAALRKSSHANQRHKNVA